jgi:ubiquinone/menaquinone biosynthesis C-methylase UbiE
MKLSTVSMGKYYDMAKKASLQIGNHPGLLYIKQHYNGHIRVLDVGCGEGSRLETLISNDSLKFGVDINRQAIKFAKKQYPNNDYRVTDAAKLPYKNNSFDLVYSAFALEHTQDPFKVVLEMVRVAKIGGQVIILCPNFGSPNRRSPVSVENPLRKFFTGLLADLLQINGCTWTHVKPKSVFTNIDDDTTVEPYLRTLKAFLISNNLIIVKCSSLWEMETFSFNPRKLIIKILGLLGAYPFKYWGPQIFVVAQKQI